MKQQTRIYNNVADRGYTTGYDDQTFLLRQIIKAVEEAMELYLAVAWLGGGRLAKLALRAEVVRRDAGALFDDPVFWQEPRARLNDVQPVIDELADVTVTLACAFTALSRWQERYVDMMDEAVRKSRGDVERGVRDETTV